MPSPVYKALYHAVPLATLRAMDGICIGVYDFVKHMLLNLVSIDTLGEKFDNHM